MVLKIKKRKLFKEIRIKYNYIQKMAMSKELEQNARRERSKKYNDKFRSKHAEMLKEKKTCEVCKRQYTYYTKSKHAKTKRHINAVNALANLEADNK